MSNMNLNCEFLEKYPLYSLINVLDYYFYKLHEDFSWLLKKQRIKDCELLEIVNQNQLKYYIFQKNTYNNFLFFANLSCSTTTTLSNSSPFEPCNV